MNRLTNLSYDVIRLLLVVALVLFLEWICRMGWVQPQVIVPPTVMLTTLWKLLHSDSMRADMVITFGAAFKALVLAVFVGMILGWLMSFAAMALKTLNGLQSIPVVLTKSALAMGVEKFSFFWHVQLPAALPSLMTGFKLAATYAFIGVIMAEFILSPNGLGHAISYAYNDFDTRTMYALMVLVMLASVSVQWVLIQIERRVLAHRATLGGL